MARGDDCSTVAPYFVALGSTGKNPALRDVALLVYRHQTITSLQSSVIRPDVMLENVMKVLLAPPVAQFEDFKPTGDEERTKAHRRVSVKVVRRHVRDIDRWDACIDVSTWTEVVLDPVQCDHRLIEML